jgi:hypothetical protein
VPVDGTQVDIERGYASGVLCAAIRVASATVPALSSSPRWIRFFIHDAKNLLRQFVLLQPVAETRNIALVGKSPKLFKLRNLPVKQHVKEGLIHGWIGQRKPLLHEVNAQQGLQGRPRPPCLAFRVIRCDEFDQCRPRNDLFQPFQEQLLARLFDVQIELQIGLFHGLYFLRQDLHGLRSYAEFPKRCESGICAIMLF